MRLMGKCLQTLNRFKCRLIETKEQNLVTVIFQLNCLLICIKLDHWSIVYDTNVLDIGVRYCPPSQFALRLGA